MEVIASHLLRPSCIAAVIDFPYRVAMPIRIDIIILTGAGLSAESGVATIRGPGGLMNSVLK